MVSNTNKGLIGAIALAAFSSSPVKAGLVDSEGNPVMTQYGVEVSTGYDAVMPKMSEFDCNSTTLYRHVRNNGGNFIQGMLVKPYDILAAGVPRGVARAIGCAIAYGEPTISVNGQMCDYKSICGSSILIEDGINAVLGAYALHQMTKTTNSPAPAKPAEQPQPTTPVAPPVAPPVTTPVTTPVAPPVAPPVTTPVAPPVAPPVTTPVAPPVTVIVD